MQLTNSPKPKKIITSILSPPSLPAVGIVPILCPFLRHKEIFLSSPALATTKSKTIAFSIEKSLVQNLEI